MSDSAQTRFGLSISTGPIFNIGSVAYHPTHYRGFKYSSFQSFPTNAYMRVMMMSIDIPMMAFLTDKIREKYWCMKNEGLKIKKHLKIVKNCRESKVPFVPVSIIHNTGI